MKTCIAMFLVFAVTLVSLDRAIAQTPAEKNKDQDVDKVVVGTNEVVLDAVVKDKKGRLVKDLSAADFEVFEDGVPQEVRSFRLVARGATTPVDSSAPPDAKTGTQPKAAPDATTPQRGPGPFFPPALAVWRWFTIGFHQTLAASPARPLSVTLTVCNAMICGVFGIDLSLHVLQRFTNNGEKIKAAVDQASA